MAANRNRPLSNKELCDEIEKIMNLFDQNVFNDKEDGLFECSTI